MEETGKRRVLLGVTGGIAAYKAAELARLLIRNNVDVQVAMTEAGARFVTPATFQALTGKPVATDLWDASIPNAMAHIELSRGAEAIVVAPASADFLAKVAHGLANDLLSTACLARSCPLFVAPAMNREMWDNPAMQRNLNLLRADGVVILGPSAGEQACGETGMGRLLEPEELLQAILAFLSPKRLAGRTVLVTAGPTFEAIDTVRGITNQSSGKMGYALAEAAAALGADVTLVSGPDVPCAARERAFRLRHERGGNAQCRKRPRVVGRLLLQRRGGRGLHARGAREPQDQEVGPAARDQAEADRRHSRAGGKGARRAFLRGFRRGERESRGVCAGQAQAQESPHDRREPRADTPSAARRTKS